MSENRSILINHTDGGQTLVENIPGNAKITYGPVSPAKGGYGQNVLRIYTSESNQLGVFNGVESFRDLSLTVKVKEITLTAEEEAVYGPNKSRRSSSSRSEGHFVTQKLEW